MNGAESGEWRAESLMFGALCLALSLKHSSQHVGQRLRQKALRSGAELGGFIPMSHGSESGWLLDDDDVRVGIADHWPSARARVCFLPFLHGLANSLSSSLL